MHTLYFLALIGSIIYYIDIIDHRHYFDSLDAVTEYAIMYQLCDGSVCSDYSPEARFTTLTMPPPAVTNVATVVTATTLSLTWTTEYSVHGRSFYVVLTEANDFKSTFVTTTSASFTDVKPGTTFEVAIVTVSPENLESEATALNVTTVGSAPQIVSLIASDPLNDDVVMDIGDLITVTFDVDTNMPADIYLICNRDTTGAGLIGTWQSPKVWVATVTKVEIELWIHVLKCHISPGVIRASGPSDESTNIAALNGNWGTKQQAFVSSFGDFYHVNEDSAMWLRQTFTLTAAGKNVTQSSLVSYILAASGGNNVCIVSKCIPGGYTTGYEWVYALNNLFGVGGIRSENPVPNSIESYGISLILTSEGIVSTKKIAVVIVPVADIFIVAPPQLSVSIPNTGGKLINDASVADVDIGDDYRIMVSLADPLSGQITYDNCNVPLHNAGSILSGVVSLDDFPCVFSNIRLIPSASSTAAGSLVASLLLEDLGATNSGSGGTKQTFDIHVQISCTSSAYAHLHSCVMANDMTLTCEFDKDVASSWTVTEISDVFDSQSSVLFGSSAYVVIGGPRKFRVFPGGGSTFMTGDVLTLKNDAFYACYGSSSAGGSAVILPPVFRTEPTVAISGPEDVAFCSNGVTLRTKSTGLAGRKPTIEWSAVGVDMVNSVVKADGSVTIPATSLNPGTFDVQAKLTNVFGETATAVHTISVSSSHVPEIIILPKPAVINPGHFTRLRAEAGISPCLSGKHRNLLYSWTSDPPEYIVAKSDTPSPDVNPAAIQPNSDASVTVTVSMVTNPSLSVNSTVIIKRTYTPPSSRLTGGFAKSWRSSLPLILDGSDSVAYDGSLQLNWACKTVPNAKPCYTLQNHVLVLAGTKVEIPSSTLPLGTYSIVLTATDSLNMLTDSFSQTVTIQPAEVPIVTLTQTTKTTVPEASFCIRADVTSDLSDEDITIKWTSSTHDLDAISEGSSSNLLCVNATLRTGLDFVVTATATDPSNLSAAASTTVKVSSAPYGGRLLTDSVIVRPGLPSTLSAVDWQHEGEISYRFVMETPEGTRVLLSDRTTQSVYRGPIPTKSDTVEVIVEVYTADLSMSSASVELVVLGSIDEDIHNKLLDDFSKEIDHHHGITSHLSLLVGIDYGDSLHRRQVSNVTAVEIISKQINLIKTYYDSITPETLFELLYTLSQSSEAPSFIPTFMTILKNTLLRIDDPLPNQERQRALQHAFVAAARVRGSAVSRRSSSASEELLSIIKV